MTKITQRKRKQPEWLVNDVHPVLDLTEDGDDSESLPMSVFESACNENGKDSPPKTVDFPSSDQEILSDNQEEDDLPSSNSAKDSPIVKDACKPRNFQLTSLKFHTLFSFFVRNLD